MERPPPPSRRRSLLLRMWQERSDQSSHDATHFSIESPTGERREFDSPAAVARYLSDLDATMHLDADATDADASRS
jgi:predicted nucleic acid-binding Zn ribbon protein